MGRFTWPAERLLAAGGADPLDVVASEQLLRLLLDEDEQTLAPSDTDDENELEEFWVGSNT